MQGRSGRPKAPVTLPDSKQQQRAWAARVLKVRCLTHMQEVPNSSWLKRTVPSCSWILTPCWHRSARLMPPAGTVTRKDWHTSSCKETKHHASANHFRKETELMTKFQNYAPISPSQCASLTSQQGVPPLPGPQLSHTCYAHSPNSTVLHGSPLLGTCRRDPPGHRQHSGCQGHVMCSR